MNKGLPSSTLDTCNGMVYQYLRSSSILTFFFFSELYTEYPVLLNNPKTAEKNPPKETTFKMNNPFATPLSSLVRPEHMLNPKLRFSEQQQQHYFQGCSGLWETIRANPKDGIIAQQAHRKLVALTVFLTARVKAAQALSHRTPLSVENAIQTLIQQTSGARPIPSWSEFEAGTSSFHGPRARNPTSLSEVRVLESAFGSFDMTDKLTDKLTEENVAVALTFLGCDIGSTNADEIEAVLRLLDLQAGSREELEKYLLSVSR